MVIGTQKMESSNLACTLMGTSRMLRETLLQIFGAMCPFIFAPCCNAWKEEAIDFLFK
jgi:hypothetical protein